MIIGKIEDFPFICREYKIPIKDVIEEYASKPKGEYRVSDLLTVKKVISKTKAEEDAKIESHCEHIDIQIPLDVKEFYKIYDVHELSVSAEYDSVNDVIYYHHGVNPKHQIIINPGEFVYLDV